jgi:hypothetical protein
MALTLATALAGGTPGRAELVTFRDGVNGYTGTADTWLRIQQPDTPQGSSSFRIFISTDGGHGLLRFDGLFGTNPGQIPLGSTIVSATLSLTTGPNAGTGHGGTFHRMLLPWDEATATWNSFTDGIQADGVEAVTAVSAAAGSPTLTPLVPTGPISFNMTADLAAWSGGAPNYGWAILPWPGGHDGWGWHPSEESNVNLRPMLQVNFVAPAAVPAPPAVVLLAVGGLGVVGARLRRRANDR